MDDQRGGGSRDCGNRPGNISDVERGVPDGRHFDFPRLISTLREIGYAGYLVFEYNSVGSGVPEARAGLEYIKSVLLNAATRSITIVLLVAGVGA